MKPEDQVLAALKALAAHDREREAPEQLEGRILEAFRRKSARRSWRQSAMWSLAAAAGIAVAIFLAFPREHVVPVATTPREITTEFFPLMDVQLPFERGQLLRVMVPAGTLRTVGLPVNEDRLTERVQADVLVGEEGLARAIRFVSYEQ